VTGRRALVAAALLLGCGTPAPPPVEAGATRAGVPADAHALGNELFDLVDRAVEYRAAHMGRPATSLRDLGVDSLSAASARTLVGTEPIAFTAALRRPGGSVTSCSATEDALEQASLNDGRFAVECETADGPQRYEVVRPVAARKAK
jgi:hypothetical protein